MGTGQLVSSQPTDGFQLSLWESREFVKSSCIDKNRDCQFLLNFIPCVEDFVFRLWTCPGPSRFSHGGNIIYSYFLAVTELHRGTVHHHR